MVASLFAEASQRAINDGVSGVLIERNPNITDASGAYASTSMFILREMPRYTGDSGNALASGVTLIPETANTPATFEIVIPLPIEQTDLGTVRPGDQISFGDQTQLQFAIRNAIEDGAVLRLICSTSVFGAPPTSPSGSEFIIERQPRKLVSSRVDMPTGYLVDLRLSGEVDSTDTFFAQAPDATSSVSYLFNGRGSIDRFFYANSAGALDFGIPRQPAYLMVREYSADEGGELIENVLNSERQMWVTVDPTTGAANVIPGVGVDTAVFTTLPDRLKEARQLGSQGQAAQ